MQFQEPGVVELKAEGGSALDASRIDLGEMALRYLV